MSSLTYHLDTGNTLDLTYLGDCLLQGKQRYDSMLADRQEFNTDIKSLINSLQSQIDNLIDNCLTEDWRIQSSEAVIHALQVPKAHSFFAKILDTIPV